MREMEVERRAEGDMGKAKKGTRQRVGEEVREMMEREWYVKGMFDTLWRDKNKIGDMVVQVKVVLGILATMGVRRAHRGLEGVSHRCRLCGRPEEDGGETNYHVLWECPGVTGGVKDARRKMVGRIQKAVSGLQLEESREIMATALWRLEDGCRQWESVEELALLFEDEAFSKQDQVDILEAVQHMEGGAMRMSDRGMVGKNWEQLLVKVGVEEGEAQNMVGMMTKETVKGCADIWRAFMREVGDTQGEMGEEEWEIRRAVLESVGEERLETVSRSTMRKVRRLTEGEVRQWVDGFMRAVEGGEVEQVAADRVLDRIRKEGRGGVVSFQQWKLMMRRERAEHRRQRVRLPGVAERGEAQEAGVVVIGLEGGTSRRGGSGGSG